MATVTACATLGYAAFDLPTAVARIAQRGFRKIEITELSVYCRHLPFDAADTRAVSALLRDASLTPVAMNVNTGWEQDGVICRPDPRRPEHAAEMRRRGTWFINRAAELDVSVVTMPAGVRVDAADWPGARDAAVPVLRDLADHAATRGITLCLESPHLYLLTDSVDHAIGMLDAVDRPNVGVTVDSSHWGIIRYDVADYFARLGDRLRHVHLRDSRGADTRDFAQDLEHTPGKGAVDFALFGRALDDAGYAGEVTLEMEHRHGDLAAIEREYDDGITHLREVGWNVDL